MNELIFSDLHFHEHSTYYETKDPYVFVNIELDVLKQIEKYIWDQDIFNVFILGDLFNQKDAPVWYISKLQGIFYSWSKIRNLQNIVLLRGTPSHDGNGKNYLGNLFRCLPKVKVVTVPLVFESFIPGNPVLMIPSCPQRELIDALKQYPKPKILMMHDAIKGVKIADYQLNIKEFIDVKHFNRFKYVFSGHIHKYQKLGKNIYYVGSPYRITFAEKNDPKGFIHLTNDGPEFIELEGPKMIEFDFGIPWMPNQFKEKFVKLNYKNEKKHVVNAVVENMLKAGALGVKTNKIYMKEEKEEKKIIRLKEKESPESMINKYIDLVDIKDLDKRKILRIGKTAIREGEKYGSNP